MQGEFYLFINFKQAAQFGHVGWGFLMRDGVTCLYGATDHLYRHHEMDLLAWFDYMSVPPGEHTDWWCGYGPKETMLKTMGGRNKHHIWYHACRAVPVPNAKPEDAEKVALSHENGGWTLLTNNCVQQTYEIIAAYGADSIIPNPWQNPFRLIPRVWFNSFAGEVYSLNE